MLEEEQRKKKNKNKKEDIRTRLFLSHKRSSAQGMTGRMYQGLSAAYRVFLDSEADFDLHDLEAIVAETDTFVFILSGSHGLYTLFSF